MTTSSSELNPDARPADNHSIPDTGSSWSAPLIGALLGFTWYLVIGGWRSLNPGNFDWIIGDHSQHLLGWLFFRNEPLTFPLGRIEALLHPVGTTVGFTDANPWVSLLLRPVSFLLPVDFQFIGPWLALCFVLQGVFGAKIMEAFTSHAMHRACGAAMFVLAPPLVQRMGHDTLAAHWMLLAMIWLNVRRDVSPRRALGWAYVVNVVAAGVHPYLAMMVVAMTGALLTRLCYGRGRLAVRTALVFGGGVLVQTAAIFVLFGYLGSGETLGEGGFGVFSADVLTFFNSMGYSKWLPPFSVGQGQYEGFGYLGLGALMLLPVVVVASAVLRLRPTIPHEQRPLWIAVGAMALFAFSSHVTVAGFLVLTMRKLYDPFAAVVDPMRASGRFIWPLHYVVLAMTLAVVTRRQLVRPAVVTLLLLAAAGLQGAEVRRDSYFNEDRWPRVESPVWQELAPSYRHLVLFPAYYAVGPSECQSDSFEYAQVVQLSDLAYRSSMTINSAYVARASMSELRNYCGQLHADVSAGRFGYDSVYIVAPEALSLFTHPEADATCGELDGFNVCVSNSMKGLFRRLLMEHSSASP